MVWFCEALEIADEHGKGTGRYRMTASSDEGGGGPFGDPSHDHATVAEAHACDRCDEFVAGITGMPSRKRVGEMSEADELAEYARLKAKFGDDAADAVSVSEEDAAMKQWAFLAEQADRNGPIELQPDEFKRLVELARRGAPLPTEAEVRADEREKCAKIVENLKMVWGDTPASMRTHAEPPALITQEMCAAAIRAADAISKEGP